MTQFTDINEPISCLLYTAFKKYPFTPMDWKCCTIIMIRYCIMRLISYSLRNPIIYHY